MRNNFSFKYNCYYCRAASLKRLKLIYLNLEKETPICKYMFVHNLSVFVVFRLELRRKNNGFQYKIKDSSILYFGVRV